MSNPLLDKEFLKKLDGENQKQFFAKIISLNTNEEPIECIEGVVSGGSINIDGASSVRRSCSLTLVSDKVNINDFYWGLTNKFKLYIGLENTIDKQYDDIIWFLQGIYIITSFKTNYTQNSYQISISGKDKMCLLNGEVGGALPAATDIAKEFEYEDGEKTGERDIPIKEIIREVVHYYGNEPFHNIIIRDVENDGLEMLSYDGNNDIFLIRDHDTGEFVNVLFDGDVVRYTDSGKPIKIADIPAYYSLAKNAVNDSATIVKNEPDSDEKYQVVKCSYGETAGYRTTELTWPGKDGLIINAGDPITSGLDKIVQTFGDYEYFYDIEGRFVFQRKLTYIQTSWNNIIFPENDETYVESAKTVSQYSYNFANSLLTASFDHTPKFDQLHNDYAIWGKKNPVASGSQGVPIHLRYAIDKKPDHYVSYDGTLYCTKEYEGQMGTFVHSPNPAGLSDDWWDCAEWAEYYKATTADNTYPPNTIGTYCKYVDYIDLNTMFERPTEEDLYNSYGQRISVGTYYGTWVENWEKTPIYIFDLTVEGKLGYTGHASGCGHPYQYFLDLYDRGARAYIYKPEFPSYIVRNTDTDWRELIYQMAVDYYAHNHEDDFYVKIAQNNPQFPYGKTGYEQYYVDMLGFWRGLYNPSSTDSKNYFVGEHLTPLEEQYKGWNRAAINEPESIIFWFDFLDATDGTLGKYSVPAIGDRTKVVNEDAIKVITYKEVSNLIYITREEYEELASMYQLKDGYNYIIIPENYIDLFSVAKQGKTAQQELDNLIYENAYINEEISIRTVPIYYLEPNTLITVEDKPSGIHGEYIINKMTIPLNHKDFMTIQASKVPLKLY